MKDNAINVNGIDVYMHDIYYYVDEYIDDLKANQGYEDDEIKALMRKAPIFKGMLKYIYINIFKPDKNTKTYNNIKQNSNIDYGDIDLLNGLWDIYTSLCYKYLQIPTLLNFSLFTGISMDWFNDCKNGKIRAGGNEATSSHCQSVKNWLAECEAALYDGATTGNPGPMFLLKANYGYTEAPQRIEVVGQDKPQISMEELDRLRAERRELPQKPEFD